MARKNLTDMRAGKLAKLKAVKAEIAALEEKAATRIGKLAVRAGLADLHVTDADLLRGLEALAARFRGAQVGADEGGKRLLLAEKSAARASKIDRKADTRRKIQLGG